MIASLRGTLLEKDGGTVVLDVAGVGYEVHVAAHSLTRLTVGQVAELYICESTALYGGGTTLYGFLSRDEKEIFLSLRDHVPSTGAKKALEYLDKASRSLPDFRRAILDSDARMLAEAFGFSKKTAERLIHGLKDKLGDARGEPRPGPAAGGVMSQALDALSALGYRAAEARAALQSIAPEIQGRALPVEDVLRLALKRL